MDTNAIINAAMQQLVSTVADEVICRLKAESSANMALDKDALAAAVLTLMQFDTDIREEVRCISDEHHFNIENVEAFTDLKSEVEALTEKLDEMETNGSIDADDSDFQDAVCSVIRNHI
jgi:hypothetical protein